MPFEPLNIPLSDNFIERSWVNYNAYEKSTAEHLPTQRHVDLRTFTPDSKEAWTLGTAAYQSTVGKFPGLLLKSSGAETMTTTSTVVTRPVNLIEGFESTDYLIFALPAFPLSKVATTESYLELSDGTHTIKVALSETLTALIEGDSEFKITRSLIEGSLLDLTAITTVKFVIKVTAVATIIIMGLKLVSKLWVYDSVDFDNWNGRLRKPTPTKGLSNKTETFVQGPIWRSAPIPGINDPMPVDLSMGVSFNTGAQEKENELSLYFRERPISLETQIELEGITMAELDGKPQPDYGLAPNFMFRKIGELEGHPMEYFDNETMEKLERAPNANPLEETWVRFTLKWGSKGTKVLLANSLYGLQEGEEGYELGVTSLNNEENYLFVGTLEGGTALIQIYKLTSELEVEQTPVYESPAINDNSVFHRNQGRFGWQATINDPNSFVRSIRQRSANFAEYASAPLPSFTPVAGAQLFASFTANEELWNGEFYSIGSKVQVTRDTARALTTAGSFKVITSGLVANEGLISHTMEFLDFNQVEIVLSVWFAGPARTGKVENLTARLISPEGPKIPLTMPELEPEQWQHIKLNVPTSEIVQTGPYALEILQPTLFATTWWIDAVSIYERAVQWSARSIVSNPWDSNFAPWTDFRDIVNVNDEGIILSPRGKELQLRARALRQNATINSPKLVPVYAQLGRLVWPEEKRKLTAPIAKFKAKEEGSKTGLWKFTDESLPFVNPIGVREWDFGDGTRETGNLIIVEHEYKKGTYYAYLAITDRDGRRSVTKTTEIKAE